jgi:hypothetical protein
MNTVNFAALGLQLRLAFARFGLGNGIACVICIVGAASWTWGLPHLNAQLEIHQQSLNRAQQILQASQTAPPEVQKPLAEQRLESFYDTLGERRFSEQQIKTLFSLAQKSGLTLHQAEYKSTADKNGRFHTYQIVLPVKGSYGAIREFCEQTLLAIPFASLDELSFKREAIASGAVEARLRFTLYLSDLPASGPHIEAAVISGSRS